MLRSYFLRTLYVWCPPLSDGEYEIFIIILNNEWFWFTFSHCLTRDFGIDEDHRFLFLLLFNMLLIVLSNLSTGWGCCRNDRKDFIEFLKFTLTLTYVNFQDFSLLYAFYVPSWSTDFIKYRKNIQQQCNLERLLKSMNEISCEIIMSTHTKLWQ